MMRLQLSQTTCSDFSELVTPTFKRTRGVRALISWLPWLRTMPDSTASQRSRSASSFVCEFSVNPRNHVFLVLRFDEMGKHTYLELNRNDVLQIIRQAEANPLEYGLRDSLKTKEKRAASVVSPLGAFCDLQPVHMRDLRQLDESFTEPNETTFVVRKQAILINADPIRSIITRNATLVFVPDGADSLLQMLIKDFDECVLKEMDSGTPYEFRALEALLDTLSRCMDEEYELHANEITNMLDSLVAVRIMSGELETMRLMKNSISAFEAQVDSIRRALMELLNNEEDLRLLYLSKLYENPSLIYDLGSFDPEEVEVLLESYLQDIYSTRTKSELLQHRIQTTESLVTMKLDYARNYLLALQLVFSLVGVGIGVGTLISGIFGMNLRLDVPNTVTTFWWVLGIILVGCVAVIWGGVVYFRRQGLMIAT